MEFTTHFGLHSQTTRLSEGSSGCARRGHARDCHPLRRALPGQLRRRRTQHKLPLRPQFSGIHTGDFRLELFPLRSPLLGESLLVSFPPLSNMLKFGGWALSELRSKGMKRSRNRGIDQDTKCTHGCAVFWNGHRLLSGGQYRIARLPNLGEGHAELSTPSDRPPEWSTTKKVAADWRTATVFQPRARSAITDSHRFTEFGHITLSIWRSFEFFIDCTNSRQVILVDRSCRVQICVQKFDDLTDSAEITLRIAGKVRSAVLRSLREPRL